ncbi:MAG: UDP-N-acetylmuramoyl-tripeptide--D-alanyl-D-alanine ligase [Saprospiraceae bacterium]|nr:UDP-N-acetylmuramoyl-tripeptide--D-alanyl-D-alanine ligase [Saprospiraceae bacterium]
MIRIPEIYQRFQESAGVFTDTRKVLRNGMFIAIRGQRFDGNHYAIQSIQDGALCSLVDDQQLADEPGCIYVPNTITALQRLARYHRDRFDIPVLALTGSNGKTTTKELITSVLSQKFRVHATQGNLNNHLGVPLTLLGLNSDADLAVVEMGANQVGEINWLCHIAAPTIGLITNIGSAHIEGFGSQERIGIGKSELYRYLDAKGGEILVNQDEASLLPWVHPELRKVSKYGEAHLLGKLLHVRFGVHADQLNIEMEGVDGKALKVQTQLYGDYNRYNVVTALAIGGLFGVSLDQIAKGVASYTPKNNRSQLLQVGRHTIYLDAYNANPTSMRLAVDFFKGLSAKYKVIILGDMLELGKWSDSAHTKLIQTCVSESSFRRIILLGPIFLASLRQLDLVDARVAAMADSQELIDSGELVDLPAAHILLKGSRKMRLESLATAFEKYK